MINFMKYKWIFFIISGMLVILSIISLGLWRLQPSIDFTGGALLELQITNVPADSDIRKVLNDTATGKEIVIASVQAAGNSNFLLRTKTIDETKKNEFIAELKKNLPDTSFSEQRFEVVGPTVGVEVTRKTVYAVIFAVGIILLYVAWISRKTASIISSWKFGVCAVAALLHDTIIILGVFSILGHFFKVEVDLLIVTAILTIMSFSVHDTIVVFDRIKEMFRKQPKVDIVTAVNVSLTETMGRSVNNSLTIIIMLFALLMLGGTTIFYFILALLIGSVLGTYSSPFVATPFLVVWESLKQKKSQSKK